MAATPEFKNWMTFGNVLTIGAMVAAALIAWGTYTTQSHAMQSAISDHETRLRAVERSISESLSRIDQRLQNIERASAH